MKEILEESGDEATWESDEYQRDTETTGGGGGATSVWTSLDATIERLDQLVIKHRKFFDKEQFNGYF